MDGFILGHFNLSKIEIVLSNVGLQCIQKMKNISTCYKCAVLQLYSEAGLQCVKRG